MNTHIQPKHQTQVMVPVSAVKYLYGSARGQKIVCEIDLKALRMANKQGTIDDMVAQARLEYFAGETKGFVKTNDLMKHLGS